jgi:hypothetical protein
MTSRNIDFEIPKRNKNDMKNKHTRLNVET